MNPVHFEGVNMVIAENQPPYTPLPVRFLGTNMGICISCWELTDEEIAAIVNTRRIWGSHLTFNSPFQPLALSTDRPNWEGVATPPLTCDHGCPLGEHCPQCQEGPPKCFDCDPLIVGDVCPVCVKEREEDLPVVKRCPDCGAIHGETAIPPGKYRTNPVVCPQCIKAEQAEHDRRSGS